MNLITQKLMNLITQKLMNLITQKLKNLITQKLITSQPQLPIIKSLASPPSLVSL